MTRREVVLERTFRGVTLDDVWEMWTTKEGIEAWWGPDGFRVEVHALDLRVDGELRYSMIAEAPEQVAFMKREGMPVSHPARIRFTDVNKPTRLAYVHDVDFVPGVATYDVKTRVELTKTKDGVRLVLTMDAMHDEEWTGRATAGWEMELTKLSRALARKENV